VRFVVVVNPLSNEVSSNEDGLRRLLADDLTTDPDAHESYLAALRGLPVIDLWPAFAAAEAANGGNHPALYLTSDAHLSATGRSVFGTAFAEAVERLNNGL
jgi:lysophospholipase L1-like esterase